MRRSTVPLVALATTLAAVAGSWLLGHSNGLVEGINSYHLACYQVGGIVIDEGEGTAVMCQGLTKVEKEGE